MNTKKEVIKMCRHKECLMDHEHDPERCTPAKPWNETLEVVNLMK